MAFAVFIVDILTVFNKKNGVYARRDTLNKMSNGNNNPISIFLRNNYPYKLKLKLIDEVPEQFQIRDMYFAIELDKNRTTEIKYELKPVKRGNYNFGAVNVFAYGFFRLTAKRYKFSQDIDVPVYPSFMQMRKYELMAISDRLTEIGVKKIRKIGHDLEFDQIRNYVIGDDYRHINWKATARRGNIMVNQYRDESSQRVYSLIDTGRVMKMPFKNMSLLDYSINASLVISNIAMLKYDKSGVFTFSNKVHNTLPASSRKGHINKVMELLYDQDYNFLESDFERLYVHVKRKVSQRSLFLLFSNFETLSGLRRQLPYLRFLAKDHVLVVIFFINTELQEMMHYKAETVEAIYKNTIAEKFMYEKKQIVKELKQYGIYSILTEPENLTINTINKYLEFKARGMV
ncbi:MAG: DUF58 domain-containing protein [Flavobacteriales bacterium]